MPNWKKLLTSGSNIQISELTLDAAGVTKASIDTSGNIAAEGTISSSAALGGTRLTINTAGVSKASISPDGEIAAEGFISSSGLLSGTSLDIKLVNALPKCLFFALLKVNFVLKLSVKTIYLKLRWATSSYRALQKYIIE